MGLFGREAERARVRALVDGARAGSGGALLLHGVAGAGKTALLDHAAAAAQGMTVVRATCAESEQPLAYAAVHQLLAPALELLPRIPDAQAAALRQAFGLAPDERPARRFVSSLGMLALLAELAGPRPVLCVVDDVQWADDASKDALAFMARRIAREPVAMLLARRDGEDARFGAGGLATHEVGPLGTDAALHLLQARAGIGVAPEVRDRLLVETRGNALALTELASTLDRAQLAGLRRLPAALPGGRAAAELYAARVAALDPPTRLGLLVAALHGAGGLRPVLDALERLGLRASVLDRAEGTYITVRDDRVEFRHPLIRAAICDAAPFADRRLAHEALAHALDDDPDRRAWHLAHAAVGPDPPVGAALEEAAARAERRGAYAAASAAVERAAELAAAGRRAPLLTRAALLAWRGGRAPRAAALAERVAALDPADADRRAVGRLLGTLQTWAGEPLTGCELLCREAELAAPADPATALQLLAEAAEAASFTGDDRPIERVGELAGRLPVPSTPRGRRLRALLLGSHRFVVGRPDEAARLLRAAVEGWESLHDPEELNWAGRAAIYLGDERLSLALDRRASEIARETGDLFALPSMLVRIAITELWLARPAAADADGAEALLIARETGQVVLEAAALATLAYAAALRGDPDAAAGRAREALAITGRLGLGVFADLATTALAHVDLVAGRHRDALAKLDRVSHRGVTLPTMIDRVEAAVGTGRLELAERWAGTAVAWAEATDLPAAAAIAAHCMAVIAPADEAPARFALALERHTRSDRPFERARTELAFGRLLRRRRSREDARAHLLAAAAGFEAIGAPAWADQARSELRATGQTLRERGPHTRDRLTPQERRIADHVARGLTNRDIAAQLFLSPRTVDFHLRNVFAKLGIASRTELARLTLDPEAPEARD